MALGFVKTAVGTSAVAVTTPAFGSATTSGNLIVLAISADDTVIDITGWTQSSEMGQADFMDCRLLWKISAGETTVDDYTINSASPSAWVLAEFEGNAASPYDASEGQLTGAIQDFTTPNIIPSTGQRLLVACGGGHDNNQSQAGDFTNWLNSFTRIEDSGQAGPGNVTPVGIAFNIVAGDGSTTFSSGASFPGPVNSSAALIISFKEADVVPELTLMGQVVL